MGARAINQVSSPFGISTYCNQTINTQNVATPLSTSDNQHSFNFNVRKQVLPFFTNFSISRPKLKK